MLKYTFSKNSENFTKHFEKLLLSFQEHRTAISESSFTQLPWRHNTALKKIGMPKKYESIAVIGIGGSNCGTKALVQAMSKTNVIFFDNTDPHFVLSQLSKLNLKKTLFIIISKSGETIEILSLASIIASKMRSHKNFLVVTDNPKSSIGKFAITRRIPIVESPKNIPGRFSILSIVGLLPSKLAGIQIDDLLKGAAMTSWLNAFKLACTQHLHFKEKRNICVFFPYCERLSHFGDWYIQLLAESIGKTMKIGITPLKALGVKDQHSQLQLFLDGPDDKFYILVKPERSITKKGQAKSINIPGKNYDLAKLFDAEYAGTKKALISRKRPFLEISLPEISSKTLGELFFFFELEVAFLGSILKVNTENQPAVELGKQITKHILSK